MNECASSLFHLFILFCFVHSNSALYFADLGKTSLSPYSPQSIAYGSLKHMRLFITCESPKPSPRYPWIPEHINSGSLSLPGPVTTFFALPSSDPNMKLISSLISTRIHSESGQSIISHMAQQTTSSSYHNFLLAQGFLSPPCPSTSLLPLQSARPQYLIWFCFSLLCCYFLPSILCPNSTTSLLKSNSCHSSFPQIYCQLTSRQKKFILKNSLSLEGSCSYKWHTSASKCECISKSLKNVRVWEWGIWLTGSKKGVLEYRTHCVSGSQRCCHCHTVNTLSITGLFSGGCFFLLEVTSVPLGVIFHILSYQVVTSYNTSASSLPPLIIPMAGHSSSVFWISTLYLLKCITKMDIPLKVLRKCTK